MTEFCDYPTTDCVMAGEILAQERARSRARQSDLRQAIAHAVLDFLRDECGYGLEQFKANGTGRSVYSSDINHCVGEQDVLACIQNAESAIHEQLKTGMT